MKNKKSIIILALLFIFLIAASVPAREFDKWHRKPSEVNPNGISIYIPETIGEVVYMHQPDCAIVGTITKFGYWQDTTVKELTMKVKDVLLGKCAYEEIIIYYSGDVKVGKEYFMVLNAMDSFAYPKNSYNLPNHDACYEVIDGKLDGLSKMGDSYLSEQNNTLEKMKEHLERLPISYMPSDNSVLDRYDSVQAMYEASDSVAKVKITSVIPENDNVDIINLDVLESYKGKAIDKDCPYIWSKGMEKGKEYFVFTDSDGLLVAREGAIIGESDDNFSEAEKFLTDK